MRSFEPIRRRGGKAKNFSFARFLYWISLLAFLGVIIYILFFSQFLIISEIQLNGLVRIDKQALKILIAEQFSGKYFNWVPKNNLLIVGKKHLEKSVSDRFKLIEEVQIKKIFPNALAFSILERNPALILCSHDNCLVVDEKGRAFAEADMEASQLGENDLSILKNEGDKEIFVGKVALEPAYLTYLKTAKEKLKSEIGLEIEKEIKTPQLVSGDIRMLTKEGWLIYLDKNIVIQKEIEMLKVVLSEKITQTERANLEYIDLRTDNKVYYKFKNTPPAENLQPVLTAPKTESAKSSSVKNKN